MLGRWLLLGMLLVATGGFAGCDKLPFGKSNASTSDEFAEFDEFDDEAQSETELGAAAEATGPASHGGLASQSHSPNPSGIDSPETAPSSLALNLRVGARFPLIKTVEQRLTQKLASGVTTGHTRLELRLSLLVDEMRPDARRLTVRYHRVRYSQNLGGEQVEYDSDQPPVITPPAALAYCGLKDNGFSFWVGADHQVKDLVGFEEFLRRCVAQVSPDLRNGVLQQLAIRRGEDGIANFVDDSIGLLPNPADPQFAGQPLQIGSSWTLPQTTSATGTRCLLKGWTNETAEIALVGQIEPSNYVDDVRQLKLTVRGGQCTGTCVVDRQTGMPTQSRIDRVVDMVAQLPDGTEIPQRKEVVTTVVAFLDQPQPSQAAAAPWGGTGGAQPPAQPANATPSFANTAGMNAAPYGQPPQGLSQFDSSANAGASSPDHFTTGSVFPAVATSPAGSRPASTGQPVGATIPVGGASNGNNAAPPAPFP